MTYLHKLAHRLSIARRTALATPPLVAAILAGCSKGEPRDFLSPNPGQPVPVVSLSISPQVSTAQPGETIQFTATGINAKGATVSVVVDWTASGGTITSDGQFTSGAVGLFVVNARLRSRALVADSARVAVFRSTHDVLTLQISPESPLIEEGEQLQLSALATLADGSTSLGVPLEWQASGGSIDGSGWFTAPLQGVYAVTALAQSGVTGTTNVNVRSPRRWLESLEVLPNSVTLEVGESRGFSVAARWNDGGKQTPQVVWSATGGTITSEGWFTAGSVTGNHKVIARDKFGTLADTAFVSVRDPTIVGLDVTPGSATLAPDANLQFSATARLSNGDVRPVGASWAASGGTVTSQGLYTAPHGAGSYRVTASVAGTEFSDTAAVTVSVPVTTLTQLVLNPSSAQVPAGTARQFGVSALYSDGSTSTPPVQWSATGGTVSSAGLYRAGVVQGTFRVIALEPNSGEADTSTVQVSTPVLVTLSLSPSVGSLLPSEQLQFSATGQRSDGSSGAANVVYSAAGGTITTGGLYTAGLVSGTFQVIARDAIGTLADTSLVTIGLATPALIDIELWPASVVLAWESTHQFQVTGTWTSGGTATPSVTYSATGGTIDATGRYRAPMTPGTYRVFATEVGGTLSDTSVVTVTTATAATLTAITVSPSTATLPTGGSQQFTASGTWSDGSTTPPTVTWSASGGIVTGGGLYAAPATPGAYQVTATQVGGTLSATATVTVQSGPTLVGVVLSPDTARVQSGATQQFSAVGRYSDGSTSPASPTYSATGGSITANGLYTAGSTAGTFRVVAVTGGFADTSVVIIQAGGAPTLVGIDVLPSSAAMFTGGGQQFSASGRFSDGSTGSVTVTWSGTGGGVTGGGLYTAGAAAGTFRVIAATAGPVADTAVVTISQAPAPGQYTTLFAKDWTTYADESALVGTVGTEANLGQLMQPALPSTDFFDLVSLPNVPRVDGTVGPGKALVYVGGPQLNTYPVVVEALAAPGDDISIKVGPGTGGFNFRKWTITKGPVTSPSVTEVFDDLDRRNLLSRINGVSALVRVLPQMQTTMQALPGGTGNNVYPLTSGTTGTPARLTFVDNAPGRAAVHTVGFGSVGGQRSHVWVRQFVRFSPNWTTASARGGEGNASHKALFLRYTNSASRHELTLDGPRGMYHSGGNSTGAPIVSEGPLPIHNTQTINQQYNTSGWPFPDAYPMFKANGPYPASPFNAPYGPGNGEWYEMVMHHKTIAERGEFTLYWRQLTVGGVRNPQPWKISATYKIGAPGTTWAGIIRYEMGVNRNRQWDEDMYIYWGPYEIVDGSLYPNPWGMP